MIGRLSTTELRLRSHLTCGSCVAHKVNKCNVVQRVSSCVHFRVCAKLQCACGLDCQDVGRSARQRSRDDRAGWAWLLRPYKCGTCSQKRWSTFGQLRVTALERSCTVSPAQGTSTSPKTCPDTMNKIPQEPADSSSPSARRPSSVPACSLGRMHSRLRLLFPCM